MRFFKPGFAVGASFSLALLILASAVSPCLADVLHFHSGKIMRGKVNRVTGDIIEFTEGDVFGNKEHVKRLLLSNRRDMVQTRDKEKLYGEIIYVDKFKIDLQTATGLKKINRLRVTNVVMGTPMEQPGESAWNRSPIQPIMPEAMSPAPTTNPYSAPGMYPPAGSDVSMPMSSMGNPGNDMDEDEDAIPAVDN